MSGDDLEERAIATAESEPHEEPVRPEADERPLTETEKFQAACAGYAFRYRQVVEIFRESKDLFYEQCVKIGKSKDPEELRRNQFEAADALAGVIDILGRLNAGILTVQKEEPKPIVQTI